jgi:hypothetical protein
VPYLRPFRQQKKRTIPFRSSPVHVSDISDSQEIFTLEKRLQDLSDKLAGMVSPMGKARQIIEFSGDMRKRALAKAMTPFLDEGESATAADAKGRASFNYGEEMKRLRADLQESETVKSEWEATRIQWESTRSLLSMQREMSKM